MQPNMNMNHNMGSPIPQQWWDQEGQDPNNHGQHHGSQRMSAMDAAAQQQQQQQQQQSYRSASPSLAHRMNGMSMNNMNNQTLNNNNPPPPPQSAPKGPSSNGLIRITLKKPMGIVFEPMEDPHNPSQQRGVRICDLPRTGAAAMSGMLQVGDELLSLNNKTMSRLTFDEIMDFIIDADAESVDLLFRRPKKSSAGSGGAAGASGKGSAGVDRNKNSAVKWDSNVADVTTQDTGNDETTLDEESPRGKRSPTRKNSHREEDSQYSGDDTFYTEQTSVYTEDTRQNKRGGGRNGGRRRRYESESFLDMLIDTVCAPMIGGDKRGDYSDDDMTFNSMDEDTYASGDESYTYLEEKKKRWQESRKKRSEREKRSLEEEKKKNKKKGDKGGSSGRSKKHFEPEGTQSYENEDPLGGDAGHNMDNHNMNNMGMGGMDMDMNMNMNEPYGAHQEPIDPIPYTESPDPNIIGINGDPHPHAHSMHPHSPQKNSPSRRSSNNDSRRSPKHHHQRGPSQRSPMMDNGMGMGMGMDMHHHQDQHGHAQQNPPQAEDPNEPNSPDAKIPFKEIAYDDQVEENVSVMESVGGPSLLLENLRNAQTIQRTVEPDIISKYGKDFKPDLGLTREESIQLNPERFYRHAVKKILEQNEPEKVRLIDKLFDKYLGREEHLIRKLGARYAANEQANAMVDGKQTSSDGDSAYAGFRAFGGGDFSQSESQGGSGSQSKDHHNNFDDPNAWQPNDVPQFGNANRSGDGFANDGFQTGGGGGGFNGGPNGDNDDHSDYSEESDYDSIDGTSPEVIAQVSELLNYVYGKTTVAGQIDRVSTIMRAYEGREAILLELLETKALLKANNDKGSLEDLPDSLKDNPGLQQNPSGAEVQVKENNIMSPISNMTNPSNQVSQGSHTPRPSPGSKHTSPRPPVSENSSGDNNPFDIDRQEEAPAYSSDKKKKKGFFGRFKKGKKGGKGEFPTNRSSKGALLGNQ